MTPRDADIAVVGMSGRFPRSPDLETFWANLRGGVECIRTFTEEELRAAGVDDRTLADPRYVRASGMLDGIDRFDAALFGMGPREAEITDPQQRLFLECSWEALESAACDPSRFDGRIGVYGGTKVSTYWFHLATKPELTSVVGKTRILHGNDKDYLAAWVAYRLGLRGPAVTVQTACSTSLVAVHLACQALLQGECDAALAGGVAVVAQGVSGYLYQEDGILSPDGHCRAFDARAQGTVGGDGVGVVVLKRAADAVADGDPIRALIRGSAINNDGGLKAGFTAPSVDGQAEVIAEALAVAEVDPATVGYVEAHGTGTALGDPVEIAALQRAFGTGGRTLVGSLKTNLGHLDAAAGIAGLIKTVLALESREIPPSLHFEEPNPRIDFAAGPFRVAAKLEQWSADGHPRRAGVSSFGIGGTNAHVVLEEAPPAPPSGPGRPHAVLVLSARTESALEASGARLAEALDRRGEDLADVAYSLQVGRRALEHRRVVIAGDAGEARAALLEGTDADGRWRAVVEPGHRPVAFVLPGQGAYDAAAAARLYDTEPWFREEVERCLEGVGTELAEVLRERIGAGAGGAPPLPPELAQPILFAVEHAMARLWMRWGTEPEALVGHSLGEYVAACLAGVFTPPDALRLVAERARLIATVEPGAMLAVPLSEERVAGLLPDGLAVASVNAPDRVAVAGPEAAVAELERRLAAEGVAARRLAVSRAFHSAAVEPILEPFRAVLEKTAMRPPARRVASTLTGAWAGAGLAAPEHWVRHLRETVRFSDAVATAAAVPSLLFLEVGPGCALAPLVRRTLGRDDRRPVIAAWPDPGEDVGRSVAEAIGRLWLAGVPVDWEGYHAHEERRRVVLPGYPFERQRYWVERGPAPRASAAAPEPGEPFYATGWRRAGEALGGEPSIDPGVEWVIATGDGGAAAAGLADALARRLEAAGAPVARAEGREALARALRRAPPMPRRVVHLGGVGGSGEELYSDLAALFGSLAGVAPEEGLTVDVITSGLFAVTGDEAVDPALALALGPCRSAAFEAPGVRVRVLDVASGPSGPAAIARLAGRVLEASTGAGEEPEAALRGSFRWLPVVERAPLPAPASEGEPDGIGPTWLITGGLGAIGSTLALRLARRLAAGPGARLVLVGRTPLPPREAWDALLAEEGDAGGAGALRERLRTVRALEAEGAEVMVAAADAADREAMAGVVAEARRRFGPISGAVHAAGVPGGGVMALETPERAAAVVAPKVEGARVLAALLDGEARHLVLCSSLTAVLGAAGQASYTAANAFLDHFAEARRLAGARPATVSIGWCAWREIGMAARAAGEVTDGLSPAEGADAFERILASGRSRVVVSTGDLPAMLARRRREVAGPVPVAAPQPAARYARPDLRGAYVAPRDGLEREIAEIWSALLGIEQVGVHDDFADLGGDSLLGLQVLARLRDRFGVDMALRDLVEEPTVAALALAVAERQLGDAADGEADELLDEIRSLSEDEVRALLRAEARGEEGGRL